MQHTSQYQYSLFWLTAQSFGFCFRENLLNFQCFSYLLLPFLCKQTFVYEHNNVSGSFWISVSFGSCSFWFWSHFPLCLAFFVHIETVSCVNSTIFMEHWIQSAIVGMSVCHMNQWSFHCYGFNLVNIILCVYIRNFSMLITLINYCDTFLCSGVYRMVWNLSVILRMESLFVFPFPFVSFRFNSFTYVSG